MIFDGIPHDKGLDTVRDAFRAILTRKQSLGLSIRWSYVDLKPDKTDRLWLRHWAQHLRGTTVNEVFRRDETGDFVSADRLIYNWKTSLGTLLLFAGAEIGRQDALPSEIWRTLHDAFTGSGVQTILFQRNNASGRFRELISEAAHCEDLEIRHAFDSADGQNWYKTIWLQFGFSHRAFFGHPGSNGVDTELPAWLARQNSVGAIATIDLLLRHETLYSPTFFQLWKAMAEYRRGERDSASLKLVLASNDWVLPEWSDDILICLSKKHKLMAIVPQQSFEFITSQIAPVAKPRLLWNADAPHFELSLHSNCNLSSQEMTLQLKVIYHRREGVQEPTPVTLTRQPDGNYAPVHSSPFIIPASLREVTVAVIDSIGNTIWSQDYLLWDGREDIQVFSLSTGYRLESSEDEIRTDAGYIIFVSDDLHIDDSSFRWRALKGVFAKAYLIPSGWSESLQVRTCDDHALIWKPNTATSQISSVPAKVTPLCAEHAFGGAVEFQVRCRDGYTLEAAFNGSKELTRTLLKDGSYLVKGFVLTATNPRSRVAIRLALHHLGKPHTQEMTVRINPAGMLMKQNDITWEFQPVKDLDRYVARHDSFRVFTPHRDIDFQYGWTLWEGETPHGAVAPGWRELPTFDGLGAPFTARTGTESEQSLTLANSVVDQGVIARLGRVTRDETGQSYVTIYLHDPILDQSGLQIHWWSTQWKTARWIPGNPPIEREWHIPLRPDCNGEPLAVAIAKDGYRLGAVWNKTWYNNNALFQKGREAETARNLRWLRLPILQTQARLRMNEFVRNRKPLLRSLWLEKSTDNSCRYDDGYDYSWYKAARILLGDREG